MNRNKYRELCATCGKLFPYRIMKYTDISVSDSVSFVSDEAVSELLSRFGEYTVGQDEKTLLLLNALNEIRSIPELAVMTVNAARGFVRAIEDGTAGEISQPFPECLGKTSSDAYGLIFALVLSLAGEARMKKRNIPARYWEKEHNRELKHAIKRYYEKHSLVFPDYQWSLNYFGCGLFSIGRFLYIPYRWEDTPYVYKNKDGKILALWEGGAKIRRDGQLDGVNGIHDSRAFTTVFEKKEGIITGNPVNPEGYVENRTVTLPATEWKNVLKPGDRVLAMHIPDGEGYDPGHLYSSCREAIAFFEEYYSEYTFKAFQSESWLFDSAISELLGPERNISRVKQELYCYPSVAGGEMSLIEVFHTISGNYDSYPVKTTLQRLMLEELKKGRQFHVTGAFLMADKIKA